MKKRIWFYLLFLLIGIVIGSSITYIIMHGKDAKNELSIQERIAKEAKKLMLRNDMYNYIETIEKSIKELVDKDDKIILKHETLIFKDNIFKEIDENNNIVEKGLEIKDIPFKSEQPLDNSVITINEKGLIEKATIYIEGYKLSYDFISVSVESTE